MTGVVFIVGGGPRIGSSVAEAFTNKGFRVAIGSRNPDREVLANASVTAISIDVTVTASINNAFNKVRSELGLPNVVVYNVAALTMAPMDDPFKLDDETFLKDLQVNLIGAYTCLREAVKGFKQLEETSQSGPRVFIATGNVVPFQPLPLAVTLGTGKAALVHLIEVATKAYNEKDFRFYFASQVTKDGGPVPYQDVNADAHGRKFTELVDRRNQGEWDVRFED